MILFQTKKTSSSPTQNVIPIPTFWSPESYAMEYHVNIRIYYHKVTYVPLNALKICDPRRIGASL